MKAILFLIYLVPSFCLAAEPVKEPAKDAAKIPVKDGFQTMDMNQFDKLNTNPSHNKTPVQVSSGCINKMGKEFKSGDLGYQACLQEAQTDAAAGSKNGASPSLGITLGK